MPDIAEHELVVVGGGPGGYAAAFLAADRGMKVTLVNEAEKPGGTCLHVGCIPSKALLHVARVINEAKEASKFGVTFAEPKIDVDAVQAKLQRPEYARLAQSLREIGMHSAVDLFSTYAGRKPDLEPWLRDATINRDRNLRLQYLAGLGLNLYQADVIYSDMLRNVTKMPDDLFTATPETKQSLFAAINRQQGR